MKKMAILVLISILLLVVTTACSSGSEIDQNETLVATRSAPRINDADFEVYNFVVYEVEPSVTEEYTDTQTILQNGIQTTIETNKTVISEVVVDQEVVWVETIPGSYKTVLVPSEVIQRDDFAFGINNMSKDVESFGQLETMKVNWLNLPGLTYSDAAEILNNGSIPFVEILPYPWQGEEFNISWIADGAYDAHIVGHCSSLAAFEDQEILLAFAPMMDVHANPGYIDYDWAGNDVELSINAYRRFISMCEEVAPNVTFVWEVDGGIYARQYYPGNDFVDVIGLPILGIETYDNSQSFTDVFSFNQVEVFNKPIIITQFGAATEIETSTYIEDFYYEMADTIGSHELVEGVIVFNAYKYGQVFDVNQRLLDQIEGVGR